MTNFLLEFHFILVVITSMAIGIEVIVFSFIWMCSILKRVLTFGKQSIDKQVWQISKQLRKTLLLRRIVSNEIRT